MAQKKTKRKKQPIVAEYLEKVSRNIFDKHKKAITDRTSGQQGLYTLYRNDNLYYVGLASNLKNRINHHLKDKHKSNWTHFSLYIIRHADQIKELESLLLRIAYPAGNKQKGKLRRSANILPDLKKQTKKAALKEWEDLFEKKLKIKKASTTKKKSKSSIPRGAERPLKGYFPTGKVIYATYKGKDYKAWVRTNGSIRFDGTYYATPSGAGKAITKKAIDGWHFWKYKDKSGQLQKLDNLRK